jgi:hypothetical protein
MEMADSVAYQHTDGYRNHHGSDELHGVIEKERGSVKLPLSYWNVPF